MQGLKEYVQLMRIKEQEFLVESNRASPAASWFNRGKAVGYITIGKFLKELIER
jgi:hypothetical protein